MTEKSGMPVKQEVLLEAGVHIGTKIRTNDMRHYIFKRRDDGLYILDLRKSAERLMDAAKMLARYQPQDIWVVASRVYSSNPASKFAELTGANIVRGRFVPGTMTNMNIKGFMEPKILLVCDPKGEHEAIAESAKNGVPVIALCDTDNDTKFIDLVIPINNKGKRSLALIFFILSRELLMSQNKIKSYEEFTHDIGYFEQLLMEEKKPAVEEAPAEPESVEAAQQPVEAKVEEKPAQEAKAPEPAEEKPKKKHEKKEE
jgi:small subunit ribosomal protein S2